MNNTSIEIFGQLKKISNLLTRRFQPKPRCEIKTSRGQGMILGYIAEHQAEGPVYQKDIEKNFSIRRSTATEQLKKLEAQGMIERKQSNVDARLKEIKLTQKATQMLINIKEHFISLAEKITLGITEEEILNLKNLLEKVEKNLEGEIHEKDL